MEPATRWFDESFAPMLRSGGNDLHVSSAQRKLPPELSPGFTMPEYSSPSFGSHPGCSMVVGEVIVV